jgi:hypothetical protein
MKSRLCIAGCLLLLLFAVSLVTLGLGKGRSWTAVAMAERLSAEYNLSWFTVDSGGGQSSGENYTLNGSLGQPDTGISSAGAYMLSGGFWAAAAIAEQAAQVGVYLPLITR